MLLVNDHVSNVDAALLVVIVQRLPMAVSADPRAKHRLRAQSRQGDCGIGSLATGTVGDRPVAKKCLTRLGRFSNGKADIHIGRADYQNTLTHILERFLSFSKKNSIYSGILT